ncbi:hypothetical protein C8R47DRAFT_1083965 [Mycena vitilis]|nr:hypothetical protein C8R47DRAFT_1083965 [Mycena vitilis]
MFRATSLHATPAAFHSTCLLQDRRAPVVGRGHLTVGQDSFRIEPGEAEAWEPASSESSPTSEDKAPKETERPEDKSAGKALPRAHQGEHRHTSGSKNETRVRTNRMRLRIAERPMEDAVLKKHEVKLGFMSAFAIDRDARARPLAAHSPCMHQIKQKPVIVDGQIVIRPIMVVALTYGQRLLADGRDGVAFLARVKEYLEDPREMLLA